MPDVELERSEMMSAHGTGGSPSTWRGLVRRARARASAWDLGYTVPVVALLLALVFAPVAVRDGWPMNHEGLSWKFRLSVYAAHFRRFDLLPIWSETAALGLGAPAPVLYHKLFYYAAAALYLVSGSVKASVLAALGAFTVLGWLGLRELLRRLGLSPRAALVAAAAFPLCNYAYTNWVVRGAFAEYSAMFLLPWAFRWLVGVLQGEAPRRLFRLGAVVFPALYLAHASLFYFAGAPVLGAVGWRLSRGAERRAFLGALLGIFGAFAAVALPIVVCQLFVVGGLSFAEGIAVYEPRDHYATLEQHWSGGQYAWGRTWEGFSVQLDRPLLAVALVVLVWVSGAEARRRRLLSPGARTGYSACWVSALYFAFLVTPASQPLYAQVPGFSMLQFPWRLLSFISMLSVALAAFPLLALLPRKGRDISLALAWLLLTVVYAFSPWWHEIRYRWIPRFELEAALPATARLQVGGFEYHPKVAGVAGRELVQYLDQLKPSPAALTWSTPDYQVARLDQPVFEKGERTYRVRALRPSSVVLPIAHSPFIHVERLAAGREIPIASYRDERDPRIHFDAPAGELDVRVRYPTLLSVYADILSGAAR